MQFLTTIHDVTPALRERVERMWDLCLSRGVRPALLVVPNWHGAWPIEEYPGFVEWLRARGAEGAEIFLHGERHDERGLSRTWLDRIRAFGATNIESEFLTLDREAAGRRIKRGLALLRRLGLEPTGFVAPYYLARDEALAAAAEAGLRVSEDERSIVLLDRGIRLEAPLLQWGGMAAARGWVRALQRTHNWRLYSTERLVRLALHPMDLDRDAASLVLDQWARQRMPIRYSEI